MPRGVKIIDHGFKKAVERIRGVAGSTVAVGVLDGDKYPDGTPVAAVAVFNEYGTSTAPARPFMRTTIDAQMRNIGDVEAAGYGLVIDGVLTSEDLYKTIGENLVRRIQETIKSNVPPPNAPSTIERKGSSNTLRDTDTLHDVITYRVTPSGVR